MTTVIEAPIDRILPNPEQPRTEFDPVALDELAESMRINGLVQLPTVEEAADGYYILHEGERRWRAAKQLGWPALKVVVEPALNGYTPQERLVRAVVANAHRTDLNPMEKARAYSQMYALGMTHKQIARVTRVSIATVSAYLKLLELDEELQELVAQGLLPHDLRAVRALMSVPSKEARIKLGQRLARPNITIKGIVSACERLTERLTAPNPVTRAEPPIIALSKAKPQPKSETWPRIRAAAQAVCDACDANPRLPDVPEPAWSLILEAATTTCDACNLRPVVNRAGLEVCKQCPGVELLKRLTRSA